MLQLNGHQYMGTTINEMPIEEQYSGSLLNPSIEEVYGPVHNQETGVMPHLVQWHTQTFSSPARRFSYVVVKRVVDVLTCFALIPLLLPLCALIALLVKITSHGPVFFSHQRIRQDGEFFSMWKFSTMCQNSAQVLEQHLRDNPEAREEWARTHKLQRDPRVTSLGFFLRRYSLDEIPQFWNVLRGEMALVGPRPIVRTEIEKYGDCFACYCQMKPGLTGLWQVSGRNALTYPERVALDCRFVREWSPWLEAKTLLRTIPAVIRSDGAF